ncbi:DNA N-6-adenine-methyltransferase [Chromobacterium haemolyticum]|uniref:DNA N-6-adenine-methyltransferase n=1 Tax=Chromobacterium haemolyticum TaxID=394935 RepID=UPI0040573325
MTNDSVHFSTGDYEWPTPQALFDQLNAEFGFTIDVCATAKNAKCTKFYTQVDDGLAQNWAGEVVWMNPPFGHEIKLWMAKAYRSSLDGALVVCLVPARTDTRWWHRVVMKASEVRVLDKRLRFDGGNHKAPFPAVVVVFKQGDSGCKLSAYKVPGKGGRMVEIKSS